MPDIKGRLAFDRSTDDSAFKQSARAKAVGDFVVRLFALADPNEPNLDQKIRDFLDNEEKTVDAKYANDPATAGMIKELIAARRKIFEADAGFRAAATAEQKTKAVSDFLQDVLTSVDPQKPELSVAELMDRASERVDQLAADNPELAATMLERLGQIRQAAAQSQPAATTQPAAADSADLNAAPQGDVNSRSVSPFQGVRWMNQWTPVVNVEGQWYELVSIDGVEARAIVQHCRAGGDEQARTLFSQNLPQALRDMQHPFGDTARLQLKDLRSGSVLAIAAAKLTPGNVALARAEDEAASRAGKAYAEWTGTGE